jgi:energy-coupling factor transporter transmembrane protein EcfT
MGIMQLINLFVFLLFISFLTAHFAKKRGRNPLTWLFLTFIFGIFATITLFILPKVVEKPIRQPLRPPLIKRSDAWLKHWYYLDNNHKQQGPYEFPDFIKNWKNKTICEKSMIWGEGMDEWKRLADLPDVLQEIEQA